MTAKRTQIAARNETLHYVFMYKPACTAFIASLDLPVSRFLGYISNGFIFLQAFNNKKMKI